MGFGGPQIFPFEEASSLVSLGKGENFQFLFAPLIKAKLVLEWNHHKKYHRRRFRSHTLPAGLGKYWRGYLRRFLHPHIRYSQRESGPSKIEHRENDDIVRAIFQSAIHRAAFGQLIEAKDKYIADLEALRRQDQETIAGLSAKGIADTYTGKGLIKISGGAGKTPVVKGQRQWLTYLMIWLIPMVAVGIAAAAAPKSSVFAFVGLIAALPVITMILSLRR